MEEKVPRYSWSQESMYRECPRVYYETYVSPNKRRDLPGIWAEAGTGSETKIEDAIRSKNFDGISPTLKRFLDRYFPFPTLQDKGPERFEKYIVNFISFEYQMIPDIYYIKPNGVAHNVDLKNGLRDPNPEQLKRQALWLAQEYPHTFVFNNWFFFTNPVKDYYSDVLTLTREDLDIVSEQLITFHNEVETSKIRFNEMIARIPTDETKDEEENARREDDFKKALDRCWPIKPGDRCKFCGLLRDCPVLQKYRVPDNKDPRILSDLLQKRKAAEIYFDSLTEDIRDILLAHDLPGYFDTTSELKATLATPSPRLSCGVIGKNDLKDPSKMKNIELMVAGIVENLDKPPIKMIEKIEVEEKKESIDWLNEIDSTNSDPEISTTNEEQETNKGTGSLEEKTAETPKKRGRPKGSGKGAKKDAEKSEIQDVSSAAAENGQRTDIHEKNVLEPNGNGTEPTAKSGITAISAEGNLSGDVLNVPKPISSMSESDTNSEDWLNETSAKSEGPSEATKFYRADGISEFAELVTALIVAGIADNAFKAALWIKSTTGSPFSGLNPELQKSLLAEVKSGKFQADPEHKKRITVPEDNKKANLYQAANNYLDAGLISDPPQVWDYIKQRTGKAWNEMTEEERTNLIGESAIEKAKAYNSAAAGVQNPSECFDKSILFTESE